jgi:hypothetical protein
MNSSRQFLRSSPPRPGPFCTHVASPPRNRSSNTMFLRTALFCLLSANLAVSQFAKPEILAGFDPGNVLEPTNNHLKDLDSPDSLHVIRGLLVVRQGCPTGYGECTDPAGRSVLQPRLSLVSLPPSLYPSTRVLWCRCAQYGNHFTQLLSNWQFLLRRKW